MSDDPKTVADFVEDTPEMEKLEHAMATTLSEHMELGPLVQLAMLGRMIGVVIASSTLELTDGMMTAIANILHGYNLKMTEDKPLDKKDLN